MALIIACIIAPPQEWDKIPTNLLQLQVQQNVLSAAIEQETGRD
jgi:hypothetical protein